MKRMLALFAACAPLLLAGIATAQPKRMELTPIVGYRLQSDIDEADTAAYSKIEFKDDMSLGIVFDYHVDSRIDGEFSYTYSPSGFTVIPRVGGIAPQMSFDLDIHDVQFAALWNSAPPTAKWRGFFGLGLGFTILEPSGNLESLTRFSFSLQGGAKVRMSDLMGLRFEIRWIPVYLYTTEGGYWCDPFYGCYYVGDDHFLNQFDLRAGLSFHF